MKLFKLIFILITFCATGTSYACDCNPPTDEPLSATVNGYNFIAHVRFKAIRIYSFSSDTSTNKSDFAQIEIIELFKGEKNDSINIWGIGTSCDMGIRPNDEWVIFGYTNGNSYTTSSCTHSYRILPYDWHSDYPFISTLLYSLKKHYSHPLPVLKNGLNEEYFPDGNLKYRYNVVDHKIEGDFFYRGKEINFIYNFQFKNGLLNGKAYTIGPSLKWMTVSYYINDEITQMLEYKLIDTIRIQADFSLRKNIDSLLNCPKIIDYNRLYLPDKSVLTKLWHTNNKLSSIEHKDSTGKSLFSIRYYETGEIEGSGIFDVNTGERTYTGYYKNGVVERKIIWHPDQTRTSFFYKPDGTLKKSIEN